MSDEHPFAEAFYGNRSDIDCEHALLTALIWANLRAANVRPSRTGLEPHMFVNGGNGMLFESLVQMEARNTPLLPVSVLQAVQNDSNGDGLAKEKFTELLASPPGMSDIPPCSMQEQCFAWLAMRVRHGYCDRQRGRALADYHEGLGQQDEQKIGEAKRKLEALEAMKSDTSGFVSVGEGVNESINYIEAQMERAKDIVSTGIEALDKHTSGFHGGEMWVVGARPSQGKTALAMSMLDAASGKAKCLFITLEMTTAQLVTRWNVMHSGVAMHELTGGNYTKGHQMKITNAFLHIKGSKSADFASDSDMVFLPRITSAIKGAAKNGVTVVFIDYLQMIQVSKATESRRLEIDEITRTIKTLCLELEITVVLLAQLSRAADDKRPAMGQLKESSGIEQNADIIILINRPDKGEPNNDIEDCELILEKHRNGPTGDIDAQFHRQRMLFVGTSASL